MDQLLRILCQKGCRQHFQPLPKVVTSKPPKREQAVEVRSSESDSLLKHSCSKTRWVKEFPLHALAPMT